MDIAQDYQAAQTGSVMIDAAAWGRLRFTGASRLDFLHRMSTNDVAKLQLGQGAATVFLTPIARMIDRALVLYARENETLMVTSRGNQTRVFQWLRKYIFFNDDVQIKDVSEETAMISLYGDQSESSASAHQRRRFIGVATAPLARGCCCWNIGLDRARDPIGAGAST